jgi:hypothetical protein
MATRTERDAAADLISYRLIDTLHDWMTREKRNLDGFIAHPESHVDYNQYLTFNFDELIIRSAQLGQVGQMLYSISAYKQGDENFTRGMHDFAFDNIPNIIWNRLLSWSEKRESDMREFLEKAKTDPPTPIPEYKELVVFDAKKYEEELNMYKIGNEGLRVVIEYLTQEN